MKELLEILEPEPGKEVLFEIISTEDSDGKT